MNISGNRPFTCKDFAEAQDWTRALSFQAKTINCALKDQEGNIIFELKDAEFPIEWSETACKIVASKYFNRKAKERSLATLVYRVVDFVTRGIDDDDLKYRLAKNIIEQKVSFNSPVWFNAGLDIYGIVKCDETFAYNQESDKVEPITNSRHHPQMSACFIQGIDDSISSIYDLVKKEAILFKYGSGSGTNFSSLRGANENLSHGGVSSGLMAFLPVYDRSAGAVKSGGTTRRAAKMVCLDDDHPEIMEFIEWKSKEENKARTLLEAGYSGGIDGEAYGTVSGQNSNNSIRLSDKFMGLVSEGKLNEPWHLTRRTDGSISKTVTVGELWNAINTSSWKCADPGVQFDGIINLWHTCKASGRIRASNPCSEYMFLDDSACNLASINLMKVDFIDNPEEARRLVHDMILVMDNIVSLASYPTRAIAQNSVDYRPLGLGFADLGAYLMCNGIPYDSDEGRLLAGKISNRLTCWAYEKSVLMASTQGAFKFCKKNLSSICGVLSGHKSYAETLLGGDLCPIWEFIIESAKVHGMRNAQVSVVAPTGTIGFMMDCVTTGIEPDYSLVKYKSMVGGGFIPIVNTAVGKALYRLGYSDSEIKRIQEHLTNNGGNIETCDIVQKEHLDVFDCATTAENGTRFIKPSGHVMMMAAVQPFISGAISKTVNMPNSATVEDIANIHLLAWRSGVKAVAVYRDGCKIFQPLTSTKTTGESKGAKNPEPVQKKLSSVRRGLTVEARVGGEKIFVRTGEFDDGSLGEVFIDFSEGDSTLKGSCQAFAKLLSLSLQHGMALDELCKHFLGIEFAPFGVIVGHPNIKMSNSIIDFVFRVLSFHYMKNQSFVHIKETSGYSDVQILTTSDNPKCPQCGNKTIRNGTCYKCENCGSTTGCS